jgi:phosphoglycerate dehydrogenase-like enzyme
MGQVTTTLATIAFSIALAASPSTRAAAQERAGDCAACAEAAALVGRLELREARMPVRDRADWSPPRRIVTIGGEPMAAMLRAVAPGAEVIGVTDEAAAIAAVPGADVYIGGCSREVVAAGTALKWIQAPSAGIEACTELADLTARNVLVTNAQRLYGPPIGEHVMAMMLALARELPRYAAAQQQRRWMPDSESLGTVAGTGAWTVEGKTMLVVGLGGLGTEVAWRAHGLGMRVIATRNSSREGPDYVEYVGLADEVTALAQRADVVVSAVPLTPETTGMFDRAFFAAMKPTALFINVGRGPSVVTADLLHALESGQIAGAGLDVTDPEPLPDGHPLWSAPNLIVTPHVASSSDDLLQRLGLLVLENLRRYVAGDRMLSVVDLTRGY